MNEKKKKRVPAKIVEPCLSGRWRGRDVGFAVCETKLRHSPAAMDVELPDSAWDKKGLNFAAKLLCVGEGWFPNLVQFPAFQRNGSKSPEGRSSPAFHSGNNREIRCSFFFATCGRTRCLTVPPGSPTLRRPWHSWCMASIPPMGLQCSHRAFLGKEITCSITFAACSADL